MENRFCPENTTPILEWKVIGTLKVWTDDHFRIEDTYGNRTLFTESFSTRYGENDIESSR